ncbi:MAG TPA: hypothetical protein VFU10_01345 [Gaiellaceae bacterium]|nr:hypothetical protein [Gaiellaceae bacterium]
MERSYAVAWQNGDGRQHAGRLDLGPTALRLEGATAGHVLPYAELDEIGIARLSGRPALVLRARAQTFLVACVGEPGALGELVDRLSQIRATAQPARS